MSIDSMSHITPTELDRVLSRAQQQDPLGRKIADALELIATVLDDMGEETLSLSFNGGKDCTVLLHLYAAVLYERHNPSAPHHVRHPNGQELLTRSRNSSPRLQPLRPRNVYLDAPLAAPPPLPACVASQANGESTDSSANGREQVGESSAHDCSPQLAPTHHLAKHAAPYPHIRSVYFTSPNPFPAMEAFVIDCVNRYDLDLYRFGGGMKAALSAYLGCQGGNGIKAMLMGTRRTDPNGAVAALAPTDASWPQVLRVHPILDWSYSEIWDFLRELGVRYCHLYDEGYTSLGSTTNTIPNPLLKTENGYGPAWKLEDGSQERAGRFKAK